VKTRRVFLAGLVVTGVGSVWIHAAEGSEPLQAPQPPRATQDKNASPEPDNPNMPSREKQLLEENEKDIKKKVEKLYELATELKAEVERTDSSKVLSLAMLKKTEEIEKLAKDIRNRSKG
jgi:hypothetical protein